MIGTKVAPYGSWKSPITSDLIVAGTVGLGEITLDGEDIYWIESRPTEAGRQVLVKRSSDGTKTDVTPPPFNVRTRVHEYGGGAYVVANGNIYFSNFADQQLYRQRPGEAARPLTPAVDMRYADGVIDFRRNRLICVREDHTVEGREAENSIVAQGTKRLVHTAGTGGAIVISGDQVLVSGNDFYSSPRLSPDGTRLAWLSWNHPNMPWDGTELWVAEVNPDGSLGHKRRIAGGVEESIFQPEWSPDGSLYFVSDRTGWWNLYRWRDDRIEPMCEMSAEFGLPQWLFRFSTYAIESANRIICTFNKDGNWRLGTLDTRARRLDPINIPFTDIRYLRAAPGKAVFWAGSHVEGSSIVHLDLATHHVEVLQRSSHIKIDPDYLSIPQAIEFPTEHGLAAYAFYYPPKNRDFTAPPGEKPPLLVKSHGGPTAATTAVLNLGIQYWTSRGFAVLDVNYGGSTGYGRAYRQRLNGQWGIVDVDDCVNGARDLVVRGEVDGQRLAIDGGSAGGYTTLCALTFRNTFKAGASYYGISDLKVMDEDTHKFESRYSHSLLGSFPAKEEIYHDRSPIHFIDRLSCPIILFQGLEDKIVLPNQSEMMFETLRRKGLPVAYLPFEGEQHGFRRAENIKRALDAELYFFSRVFGFELADPVEPVKIENL
ncbi:MAG: S9 family peptidase [Acidobacteriia bacterium]|nr:S9 family peptidase [Terriglobia bacterium]